MMRRCAAGGGGAATQIKNIKRFIRTDSIYCDFLFCVVGEGTHDIYIYIYKSRFRYGEKSVWKLCGISFGAAFTMYWRRTCDETLIIAFCYKSPFECNGDNRVVRSAANCDNNRSHKMQDLNWVVYAFNELFIFAATARYRMVNKSNRGSFEIVSVFV